jgi:ribosomal protein L7/L12
MRVDGDLAARVRSLTEAGQKIEAIKLFRERTGVGLKEAKDAVEAIELGQAVPSGPQSDRDLEDEVVSLLEQGQKIEAIKRYRECYPVIERLTPRSVWLTGDLGIERIMDALAPFGDGPIIVKDFVKSRKHEWGEAFFISSAADRGAVEGVVSRFLELQGDDLNEGLVFRQFVEFRPAGVHPGSGMPLTEEYRIFWLDAQPMICSPYWEGGEDCKTYPPLELFSEIAAAVRSRFFTMDLARRRDGEWMIIETGDGQVSGLPRESDADRFYQALTRAWPDDSGRGSGDDPQK